MIKKTGKKETTCGRKPQAYLLPYGEPMIKMYRVELEGGIAANLEGSGAMVPHNLTFIYTNPWQYQILGDVEFL